MSKGEGGHPDEDMTKTPHFVVYDYGQGGVWAVIDARSGNEILQKYPDLIVVDDRPAWMDDKQFKRINDRHHYDIDEPPVAWLKTLAKGE